MMRLPVNLNSLRGFSLIELMVALLIGLLVMAGVIQVAMNSKRSYLDNQETAFIQDNTRYALDIIAKDFRATGYKGCASNQPTIVNVIKETQKALVAGAFDGPAITGFEASAPGELGSKEAVDALKAVIIKKDAIDLPDSITLRTISNENEVTLRNQVISSGTLNTWQPMNYPAFTPLMVIDANCQNVSLLIADEETAGGNSISYSAATTKNCEKGLIANANFQCGSGAVNMHKPLSSGSSIFPYVANTYYIGPSVVTGMPALKRRYLRPGENNLLYSTEEIAQGVEDMQITYGIAKVNANGEREYVASGAFVKAGDVKDWTLVIAVRIELTLRSSLPIMPKDTGKDSKSPDGVLRKTVASTISLRNWGS